MAKQKKYLTQENYPLLYSEWDWDKNQGKNKNEEIKIPSDYKHKSKFNAWWICSKEKCKSSFQMPIRQRTNRGDNCPYCSGRKVNHTNSIQITHPYLYNILLPEWDILNNNKRLYEYTYASHYNASWICSICKSVFSSPICDKSRKVNGCPYCHGLKVNHTNSLLSLNPKLAGEWDYEKNENTTPDQVTYGSGKKVWWNCNNCKKSWKTSICSRTGINKNGCPNCSIGKRISKSEKEWLEYIGIPNDLQHRQVKLIPNRQFTVDGYDPTTKTVYEYYGNYYHGNPYIYNPNDYNKKLHQTFGKLFLEAMEKERLLKEAGYRVITIWESNWKNQKKHNLLQRFDGGHIDNYLI